MTGLILHHSDFDGFCSAAIAKLKNPNYETISLDYGMDLEKVIPWDKVENGNVILVDFTLEPFDYMVKLNNLAKSFIWIDHHHTSIVEANKLGLGDVEGIRRDGTAACELCWEYFYPNKSLPDAIYLIGCLDVFNLVDDRIFAFNYGLEGYETDPSKNFEVWKELLTGTELFDKILYEGKVVEKYVKQQDAMIAEKNCFVIDFEGVKFLALNTAKKRSLQFDAVIDKYEHDAILTFKYANGAWNYSLYASKNQDIDLSIIAKKYGGGGHKSACGFHTKHLVLELS